MVRAWTEFCSGYQENPAHLLERTFEEVEGYDDAVIVRNIRVESHCEHHMVPIVGVAHIGYIPKNRVVGISKLARLVDLFGKRLQTQETMTAQIADTIDKVLQPKGVAVVIDANHQCMSTRGVHKTESSTITSRMLGTFPHTLGHGACLLLLLCGGPAGVWRRGGTPSCLLPELRRAVQQFPPRSTW